MSGVRHLLRRYFARGSWEPCLRTERRKRVSSHVFLGSILYLPGRPQVLSGRISSQVMSEIQNVGPTRAARYRHEDAITTLWRANRVILIVRIIVSRHHCELDQFYQLFCQYFIRRQCGLQFSRVLLVILEFQTCPHDSLMFRRW